MADVRKVCLNNYKRILIASDVHGNGHLLWRLLERVGFNDGDALVLLGDYIEKGRDSLNTVRRIIELSQVGNVFALKGNCDTLWSDLINKRYRANIVEYMLWRKNSILCDMCKELNLPVDENTDPEIVEEALKNNYINYFEWLDALPHIIESESYVFVHAGVDRTTELESLDSERCLVYPMFYEAELSFDKYVVVGHMVLNNYCSYRGNISSFMPIIDEKRHIIMVDGGSGVKSYGQQNLLIIDSDGFHCEYEDDLPKLIAIKAQKASKEPFSIIWNHNAVEILKRGEDKSLCRHTYSGREVMLPNSLLFERNGAWASYDFTDYEHEIIKGDVVALAGMDDDRYLVKKDGALGWARKGLFTSC